jgi:hypothetical protein
VPKIQSGGRPSILQKDCIQLTETCISLGHIHLTRGNRVAEKKGSYSSVFEAVEGKLLCLKLNLEAGRQPYREIAYRKIYPSPCNIVTEKEGFLFGCFGKILLLKIQSGGRLSILQRDCIQKDRNIHQSGAYIYCSG